jgi:hypothetical protein
VRSVGKLINPDGLLGEEGQDTPLRPPEIPVLYLAT